MQEDIDTEVFISDLEDRATHGPPNVKCNRHIGHWSKKPLNGSFLEKIVSDYYQEKIYATKIYLSQQDYDDLGASQDGRESDDNIKKKHHTVEIVVLKKLNPGTGYLELLNENHDEVDYVVSLHIEVDSPTN